MHHSSVQVFSTQFCLLYWISFAFRFIIGPWNKALKCNLKRIKRNEGNGKERKQFDHTTDSPKRYISRFTIHKFISITSGKPNTQHIFIHTPFSMRPNKIKLMEKFNFLRFAFLSHIFFLFLLNYEKKIYQCRIMRMEKKCNAMQIN